MCHTAWISRRQSHVKKCMSACLRPEIQVPFLLLQSRLRVALRCVALKGGGGDGVQVSLSLEAIGVGPPELVRSFPIGGFPLPVSVLGIKHEAPTNLAHHLAHAVIEAPDAAFIVLQHWC
jgi:hypothetical protein